MKHPVRRIWLIGLLAVMLMPITAAPAMAYPTDCSATKAATMPVVYANCYSGNGYYRAWAQCRSGGWYWMAYGGWARPGFSNSMTNCWGGSVVSYNYERIN